MILILALLAWQQITRDTRVAWGTDTDTRRFPTAATQFIEDNNIRGNMFNDYGLGGWLIWRLGPDRKVFIDGRTHFYGQDFFHMNHAFEAAPSPGTWRELQNKYDFRYAVLNPRSPTQRNVFFVILDSGPDWKIVFWDQRAIVLLRDMEPNAQTARRHAYEIMHPYSTKRVAAQWENLPDDKKKLAVSELDRNLALGPDNTLALWARGYIAMQEGELDRARELAQRGIAADARHADLHLLLGQIALKRDDSAAARRHFQNAARINPRFRNLLADLE